MRAEHRWCGFPLRPSRIQAQDIRHIRQGQDRCFSRIPATEEQVQEKMGKAGENPEGCHTRAPSSSCRSQAPTAAVRRGDETGQGAGQEKMRVRFW